MRTTQPPGRRGRPAATAPRTGDTGAAVVDFALVGSLLTVLFAAVLQVALVVHVRSTLIDCAAEGARWGARSDTTVEDGVQRARDRVASELSAGYAARLDEVVAAQRDGGGGPAVVEVRITAPLPLVGLVGPAGDLTVTGHAFDERQPTGSSP